MDQKRTEFGFPRTTCSCSACANNCRNLPGMLIPDDVPRIARYLGYTDVMEFSRENLLASPGAIVLRDNQQVRIPTLVPQRGADGACKFLQNDLCTIHSVSPYGPMVVHFSQNTSPAPWVIKNQFSVSFTSLAITKPTAATHVSGPCLTPRT